MNLAAWAERNGVARVTAYRWFHAGLLPVPARKVGRLILVDELASEAGAQPKTAVYARVSSADQKSDLDRQVARVTSWATAEQIRSTRLSPRSGRCSTGTDVSSLRCCAICRSRGLWLSIGIGSAGSVRSMSTLRWPLRSGVGRGGLGRG